MPEVLSKLLVCPVVHQALAVGVEPVSVALVEAGVHLGPEVLTHARTRDDGRPLVRPVRVLLHVLGKVGLLHRVSVVIIGSVIKCRGWTLNTDSGWWNVTGWGQRETLFVIFIHNMT